MIEQKDLEPFVKAMYRLLELFRQHVFVVTFPILSGSKMILIGPIFIIQKVKPINSNQPVYCNWLWKDMRHVNTLKLALNVALKSNKFLIHTNVWLKFIKSLWKYKTFHGESIFSGAQECYVLLHARKVGSPVNSSGKCGRLWICSNHLHSIKKNCHIPIQQGTCTW